MFAEVIYETGNKSVMCVDTKEELLEALQEQHRRATSGEDGGPTGHRAERVVQVELYDKHPQDLNEDQTVSLEVAEKELGNIWKELGKAGTTVVSLTELAAKVRDLSSPLVNEGAPQESMYKMPPVEVLTEGWAA